MKTHISIVTLFLIIFLLIAGFTSPVVSGAADTWSAELTFSPGPSQSGIENWLTQDLPLTLEKDGASYQFARPASRLAQDKTYQINLSGNGDSAQIHQAVFEDLSQLLDPSGGPIQVVLHGRVQKGETLTFALTSNPSTGYSWQVQGSGTTLLEPAGSGDFQSIASGFGVPMRQVLPYQVIADGDASLQLIYQRSWETTPPTRILKLQSVRMADLLDLTTPVAAPLQTSGPLSLEGVPTPIPAVEAGDLSPDSVQDLPATFDRRTLGEVPPVRDQGGCGSCWAFGTIGGLEVAMMAHNGGGPAPDLSEQYLVSCNYDGWSCSGGWMGHDYQWWKKPAGEPIAGGVPETEFPYQASNVACGGPYTHPTRLNTWVTISNTSAAIKQAIYDHGAVVAGVCVGSAFMGYRGGVFATNEQVCSPINTNHVVTLVGWDDTASPNGVWILRNSWGPNWGEGGYMRIDRAVSNIGTEPNYVVYDGDNPSYGVCTPAAAISCGGSTSGNNGGPGSTNLLPKYTGSARIETGPEYAYTFTPNVTGSVKAILSGLSINLDIFALSNAGNSCNASNSLVWGDNSVTFNAIAGQTYYLVVEGYHGNIGDYTLSVNCSGVPPSPTNTPTVTPTQVASQTPTSTTTKTMVPSSTPTSTATQTPTAIPSQTQTATATVTRTKASAPTATVTPTPTSKPGAINKPYKSFLPAILAFQ